MPESIIDSEGFRANVGIVLCNADRRVFWGKRVGMDAWQFPQGGIRPHESVEKAMYRELSEEIGLRPEHVDVIACTRDWLRYRLPSRLVRSNSLPLCVGQKQRWYLLRLLADESCVQLDQARYPEFDHWRWVDFWTPIREVVNFKQRVYRKALDEFAPLLFHPGEIPRQDAGQG
jgi:putative (di)nucleoside polyphosphate hydrolase